MELNNCWRRRCWGDSGACNELPLQRVVGRGIRNTENEVANSGEIEATRYSYFVFWIVMPRVASTWANHKSGSDGQYGGSLRLMAATAPVTRGGVSSVIDI